MHGIILKGMKDFVVETQGKQAWDLLHEKAGVEKTIYVPVTEYPDDVVLALVDAGTELTDLDTETLLYEFGRFLIPDLLDTYDVHVDKEWTAMELIANVEEYIHEALRGKQLSEFTPPQIRSERVDDERILVVYHSDRQLCPLARGLLVGVGEYYDEPLVITERQCMNDGASQCELLVEPDSTQ